jgi:hypothetical protein
MAKCLWCGKELTKKSKDKSRVRKFCDIDCCKAYRGCKEYSYAICQYCGKRFKETRDRPNKFCSNSCSTKYNGILRTQRKKAENDFEKQLLDEYQVTLKRLEELRHKIEYGKLCKVCGQPFIAKQINQVCCCTECSRKNENKNKDTRIYKNGIPDLSINLTKLYMRDGGVCQLCGKHIDFDCDSNSDDYPSIDHIIPISKGGVHEWNNVQLACRKCNYTKGNDVQ